MKRSGVTMAALAAISLLGAACGGEASVPALSLGEEAVVQHAVSSDPEGLPTTLGVTVLGARPGTMVELEAFFEIDEEDRDKTPWYVDARFENQGEQAISRELSTGLEDQDGNLLNRVVIFNYGGQPFEPCTDDTEGELAPGESFESCDLYLIPDGRRPTRVSFLPYVPGEETDWVYWAIES